VPDEEVSSGCFGPIHLRLEALEAVPAYPEIFTWFKLGVVGVPIATALFMRLLPLGKSFPVITDASEARPTVVVGPAFVWAIPLLPYECRVTKRSESNQPFVNVLDFSQISHYGGLVTEFNPAGLQFMQSPVE
jgi:hypothetical protein